VTVVAGVFIAVSALGTFTAIAQILMVSLALQAMGANDLASQVTLPPGQPWIVNFVMQHFQLIFVCFLLSSLVTLVAATGLLLRRNWARVLFIAILVLGIAGQLASAVMSFLFVPDVAELSSVASAEVMRYADWFTKGVAVFNAVTSIAFGVLFAWIIKRLLSDPVRREFGALE
jgi:hypothetical protein